MKIYNDSKQLILELGGRIQLFNFS